MASSKSCPNSKKKLGINESGIDSLKNDNENSVDEMLANVENFIESVYRDLSICPPRRSCGRSSTLLNGDSTTSSSISTPTSLATIEQRDSISSSLTVTPPPTDSLYTDPKNVPAVSSSPLQDMDAQIERINRICENVDQNLRSIGLFMNNTSPPNNITDETTNSGIVSSSSSPTSSTSTLIINNNGPSLLTIAPTVTLSETSQEQISNLSESSSVEVIDLSNSNTQTPNVFREPIRFSNYIDEDDDVVLVSGNITPIVDLCTPSWHLELPQANNTTNRRRLNRRRLHEDYNDVDGCSEEPSISKRPNQLQQHEPSKNNVQNTNEKAPLSPNGDGRTPFMCAVCMESCLKRQPTSTVCGHVFCKECIDRAILLTHKCPLCNKKVSKKHIFRIYI